MKPTHIAIYHHITREANAPKHNYSFFAGREAEFEDHIGVAKKVRTIPIPEHLLDPVEDYFQAYEKQEQYPILGHMEFRMAKGIARSGNYYPKPMTAKKPMPRLGYALEREAIQHLQSLGVQKVSTGRNPSPDRKAQLSLAGLPVKKPTPINEWLNGLERGMRKPISDNVKP